MGERRGRVGRRYKGWGGRKGTRALRKMYNDDSIYRVLRLQLILLCRIFGIQHRAEKIQHNNVSGSIFKSVQYCCPSSSKFSPPSHLQPLPLTPPLPSPPPHLQSLPLAQPVVVDPLALRVELLPALAEVGHHHRLQGGRGGGRGGAWSACSRLGRRGRGEGGRVKNPSSFCGSWPPPLANGRTGT